MISFPIYGPGVYFYKCAFHNNAGKIGLAVGSDSRTELGAVYELSLLLLAKARVLAMGSGSRWALLSLAGGSTFGRLSADS